MDVSCSELRRLASAAFCLMVFTGIHAVYAQPQDVDELVVLLAAHDQAPSAEDVVAAVSAGQPAPGGLNAGGPMAARLAITRRYTGSRVQWIRDHPDAEESRAQRYVVLRYPENAPLDPLMQALRRNPNVLNVEPNLTVRLSAGGAPVDPILGGPTSDPLLHQRGMYLLNLPAAQGLVSGIAALGAIDTGVHGDSPELRAFHEDEVSGELVFDGGPWRPHLSEDFLFLDCDVDEQDPTDGGFQLRLNSGHGTAIATTLAARQNNCAGGIGACAECSIHATKTFINGMTTTLAHVADSLDFLIGHGTQVINMSFGLGNHDCNLADPNSNLGVLCNTISLAHKRNVILVAAAGNSKKSTSNFPARDPRVISVGGIEYDGMLWDWSDEPERCPCDRADKPDECFDTNPDLNFECGSNYGPEIDVVGPAFKVMGTVYPGFDHNEELFCGDGKLFSTPDAIPDDGLGPCTGTSVSTGHVSGGLGLLVTVRSRASAEELKDMVISTASQATQPNDLFGSGVPDFLAAVQKAIGISGGELVTNTLAPLFSMWNGQVHVYTIFPQVAMAFLNDPDTLFQAVGPLIPGYLTFPDCPAISGGGCAIPGASVYVFTTRQPPYGDGPPLVPLHQLRFDPNIPRRCEDSAAPYTPRRDFGYTTEEEGVLKFKTEFKETIDGHEVAYEYDGIVGFIFERCEPEPECMPEGTERLYRLFNFDTKNFAIFPESELSVMRARGYASVAGLHDWVGYVYVNQDSDLDGLPDGYELVLKTNPFVSDTDCDGMSDGDEVLGYNLSGPDPTRRGYSDPRDGPCLYADGFETGSTSRWSFTETGLLTSTSQLSGGSP